MNKIITFIKASKLAQGVLILILGISIGAIFYPSKTVTEEVQVENTEKIERLTKELSRVQEEYREKLSQEQGVRKEQKEEYNRKMHSMKTEIRTLQKKVKTSYYKIVKPDGTIEERRFTESEVNESTKVITEIREEFTKKVHIIENRWLKIHTERITKIEKNHLKETREYEERIEKLKKKKVVKINEKSTDFAVGILNDKTYYINMTQDIFGPFFLGVQTQTNFGDSKWKLGGSVGIRF